MQLWLRRWRLPKKREAIKGGCSKEEAKTMAKEAGAKAKAAAPASIHDGARGRFVVAAPERGGAQVTALRVR